jgi:hypothetical protein
MGNATEIGVPVNLSILFYIVAAIAFFLACIDWPLSGKMIPLGLLLFTLGHVVSGVTFKAG